MEVPELPFRSSTGVDRPRRVDLVGWCEADDGAVVYDGELYGLHQLNGPAGLVWQVVDGSASLSTLASELAEATGAPAAVVEADVLRIVDDLRLRRLVVVPGDPPPPDREPVPTPRYLGVPPNF